MTDNLLRRLERLEELQAFGERNAERLGEQLDEAFASLGTLSDRLARLERLMSAARDQESAADEPDGSARGRIDEPPFPEAGGPG